MEFRYFSFQAWKDIEFSCWSWKIVLCVIRKLLQMSKQRQNKIQANCQKIPKNKDDFDRF